MHIREIKNYSEFSNLRQDWNKLLERSSDNNIFMTWEWLSTWWKHFGCSSKLLILIAEEREKILAIAPLMLSTYKILGFKLRKVEFIGASKYSDYGNFILTEKKTGCLALFMNGLNDWQSEWDCLEFRRIPETAESLNSIRRMGKTSPIFEERSFSLCPYIPLPNSFESYQKGLKSGFRRNLKRYMRSLRRDYQIEIKRYDSSDLFQDGMKTFFELHQKRWKAKGLPGLFSNPEFRSFLLDVSRCFAENGWLNLLIMTANSKPISSTLSFECNKKLYGYLLGFDPLYSKFGPSRLLLSHLIEDCIQRGLNEFDFLTGAEGYKASWNTVNRKTIELTKVKGLVGNFYSYVVKNDSWISQKLKSIYKY
jgi:CelD/BcsL family acetyltransferase involved in cellulose biosynthesis